MVPRYTVHLTKPCEKDFKRMGGEGKKLLAAVLDAVEKDPHHAGERLRGGPRALFLARQNPQRRSACCLRCLG